MEISKISVENEMSGIDSKEQFAMDVLTGLSSSPKRISAKYFYDDVGSAIFQKITQHPDYYPTRTEYQILDQIKDELPRVLEAQEIDIIELGAGDGHKSKLIIKGFLDQGVKVNFYPIDISVQAMTFLKENIKPHQNLKVHGIVGEYFEGLRFLRSKSRNRRLVLFLGSNIGNFDRVQNQGFLRRLWKSLDSGDFALIGFDLKKNVSVLTAAYNDSAGLTEKFNLNLLHRINRELGGNFKVEMFEHFGSYNPVLGAMESFLLSTENQEVYISELERNFYFSAFEPIHLEYSFKFLKPEIENLGKQTGFNVAAHYSESKNYFINSLWQVVKESKH